MQKMEITTVVTRYAYSELSPADLALITAAREVARWAYAPYSHYRVGAIAKLIDGRVVSGNNQENAAFPSGICAERVALFAASTTASEVAIEALAIAAITPEGEYAERVSPCGACRQVMIETEGRYTTPMRVLLAGKEEVLVIASAGALMPICFNKDNL